MGVSGTIKALSDPIRREILSKLKQKRHSAGELSDTLNIAPAALSYHLKLLKQADLIMEYKVKNYIYYDLNTSVFDELILWVKQFTDKNC